MNFSKTTLRQNPSRPPCVAALTRELKIHSFFLRVHICGCVCTYAAYMQHICAYMQHICAYNCTCVHICILCSPWNFFFSFFEVLLGGQRLFVFFWINFANQRMVKKNREHTLSGCCLLWSWSVSLNNTYCWSDEKNPVYLINSLVSFVAHLFANPARLV